LRIDLLCKIELSRKKQGYMKEIIPKTPELIQEIFRMGVILHLKGGQ